MNSLPHPVKKTLKYIGIAFAVILGLLSLIILFILSPFFAAFLQNMVSDSEREIKFDNKIELKLKAEPSIVIRNLSIGNASWSEYEHMATADYIEVSIRPWALLRGKVVIPELIAENPVVNLEKNAEGEKNWDFTENPASAAATAPVPEERSEMPLIGQLSIKNGKLLFRDEQKDMDIAATIWSEKKDENDLIKIDATGKYNKREFKLDFTGASLIHLREHSEPYPYDFSASIGQTTASAKGLIEDPIAMKGLDTQMTLKGASTADLFDITGIALPPSPPYSVTGHLVQKDDVWFFNNFKGTLGSSDIAGDIEWHSKQEPNPYFKGALVSKNLNLDDLAGLIGADKKPVNDDRVIPDKPIDISRLTAMDADITFKGENVRTPTVLDNFNMVVDLKQGVLKLNPVSFGINKGSIKAFIDIEGLKTPPNFNADVLFSRIPLDQLFSPLADQYGEKNVSSGLIGGKAVIKGKGKSLRDILGNANGSIGLGMEGGRLSRLLLELVGLDIYKSLGLLLGGDKPVDINCIIADTTLVNGLLKTNTLLIDTKVTTIDGKGNINLKNEEMDLEFKVSPKDNTLVSARAPLEIGGTLKNPSFGVDPTTLAARGGAAVALGVLLTPVASIIAFLEPGLGEESNCGKFIKQVEKKTGINVPDKEKPILKVIK